MLSGKKTVVRRNEKEERGEEEGRSIKEGKRKKKGKINLTIALHK